MFTRKNRRNIPAAPDILSGFTAFCAAGCAALSLSAVPAAAQEADAGWRDFYTEVIYDTGEMSEDLNYALIYVDDDDIPELVCNTQVEAGGCQIYTWHDGKSDMLQTYRLYFTYLPRQNLIANREGHFGYYYDYLFSIQDGVWVQTASGEYADNEGEVYWRWNGEDVSSSEYEQRLNSVFATDQEVRPDYYIRDEMLQILENGQTTSAGHRYEIIQADVTWTQADQEAKARGGYLAALTSRDEFLAVGNLIRQQGAQSLHLWVGANRMGEEFGYSWITPDKRYDMINEALLPYFLDMEPSYRGTSEDGRELEEYYITMLYDSSRDSFFLNDVPDDIIDAAPSYRGGIGYIVEYE